MTEREREQMETRIQNRGELLREVSKGDIIYLLLYTPADQYTPYVVTRYTPYGSFFWGSYCTSLEQAEQELDRRTRLSFGNANGVASPLWH